MKRITLIYLAFILCLLYSCNEKDIEVFHGESQIYFEKYFVDEFNTGGNLADSTCASFFLYPDQVNEITCDLIIYFSGIPLENDTEFNVKVVEEESTINTDEFTLPERFIFHAKNYAENDEQVKDTIKIKFHKTDRLKNIDGATLVLELVETDILKLGQRERRKAKIFVTTKAAKPIWWDQDVTNKLLGEYSQKKFKLFVLHADSEARMSTDLINNHPDEAMDIVMRFKQWLNNQPEPVTEEDGRIMTIKI